MDPRAAVLVAAGEGEGRPLAQGVTIHRVAKARHRLPWHRCRWCRWRWQQALLELHGARGQAVVAESVVT